VMTKMKMKKIIVRPVSSFDANRDTWKTTFGENVLFVDITPKGNYSFLNPSFPVGGIVVHGSDRMHTSKTVQGIFECLKVFANEGISVSHLKSENPTKRKETKKSGKFLGWRMNIVSSRASLIQLKEARQQYFISPYKILLEKKTLGNRKIKKPRRKFSEGYNFG